MLWRIVKLLPRVRCDVVDTVASTPIYTVARFRKDLETNMPHSLHLPLREPIEVVAKDFGKTTAGCETILLVIVRPRYLIPPVNSFDAILFTTGARSSHQVRRFRPVIPLGPWLFLCFMDVHFVLSCQVS